MRTYLLAVFLIVLAVPALAKITEISTSCGITDCASVYSISADIPAISIGIKKTIENGLYDYGIFNVKRGMINNTVIEITGKNTIRISGTIPAGSKNLFGFSFMGDISHLNSTWWNSSFNSYLPVIVNFTDNVACILYPVNGTNGINTAALVAAGLMRPDSFDTAFIYADNTETSRWVMPSYRDGNTTYGNNSAKTTLFLMYNGTDLTNTSMYIASAGAVYLRNVSYANIFGCNAALKYYYEIEGKSADTFNFLSVGDTPMTANGGAIYNLSGLFGYGISYNGAGQYFMTAALTSPIQSSNSAAMSAWVLPRSQLAGDLFSIVPTAGGCVDECFWAESSVPVGADTARIGCGVDTNSGGGQVVSYAATLGQWAFLFCNKNTTHNSMFLNGVLVNTTTNAGTWAGATRPLTIGAHPNNYNTGSATIDTVKFYNAAQTPAYILAEYNARYGLYFGNVTTQPPVPVNCTISFASPTPDNNITLPLDSMDILINATVHTTHTINVSIEISGTNYTLSYSNNNTNYAPALAAAHKYNYVIRISNLLGCINETETRIIIISGMTAAELASRFKISDLINMFLIIIIIGLFYVLLKL
jgi:hypothetical protein